MSQEIMPNMQPPIKTTKSRDIAIGFLGWLIFSNLFFLLAISIDFFFGIIALWFFAVIAPLVLIAKKRIWVGIGIAVAVIITIALWAVIFPDFKPLVMILPLPLGRFALQQ